MPGITNFTAQIQALDAQLSSATGNLQQMRTVFTDFSRLRLQATDPQDIKLLDQKLKLIRENMKAMGESSSTVEKLQRDTERLVETEKNWMKVLEKVDPSLRKITASLGGVSRAFEALQKGSLGGVVSSFGQIASIVPKVGGTIQALSSVIGVAINAYVKFQDRVQVTNKTIIDANAAVGKFTWGMRLASTEGHSLRASIAGYSQFVGLSVEETNRAISSLTDLGFSMKEMGFDEQTHNIKTVTKSIRHQSDEWGALAASLAIARSTGVDQSKVMSQMQLQVKGLGDSVKDVALAFAELSSSAARSALSTSILMPILRGTQESFKYLGLDSSAAASALGDAGKAAKAAGLGSQAAAELMGKAMDSMAAMEFGTMAFLGQQLGMGGGLTSGFQFRQQIGQVPGGIAQDIGRLTGTLMGGTGDIISEKQAQSNDYLASIRLGQELLVSQFTGMNQREARAYLNLVEEMNITKAQGKDTKAMADKIKAMEEGEAGYRARTLTMQQKIAQFLEVITALIGRMLITFARAFVGGAAREAEGGLAGLLKKTFEGIEKGKGIDEMFTGEGGDTFQERLDKSFVGIESSLEKWADRLGRLSSFFFDSWIKTLLTLLGIKLAASAATKIASTAVGAVLGGAGTTAAATTVSAIAATPSLPLATSTVAAATTKNAGVISRLFAGLSRSAGGVLRLFTGLGRLVTSLLPALTMLGTGLAAAAVGIGVFKAASWALEKTGLSEAMENAAGKVTAAFLGAESAVKEHNKAMLSAKAELDSLVEKSDFKSSQEAELAMRSRGGAIGIAAFDSFETSLTALKMVQVESDRRLRLFRDQLKFTHGDSEATMRLMESIESERKLQRTYSKEALTLGRIQGLDPAEQQRIMGEILSTISARASNPEEIAANAAAIDKVLRNAPQLDITRQAAINHIITLRGGDALTAEMIKNAQQSIDSGVIAPGPGAKSGSGVGLSKGYNH